MYNNYYQWTPSIQYPSQVQYTYYHQHRQIDPQTSQLKNQTLATVEPIVQYGLGEAQVTSYPHAIREVAAISYLMGKGYSPQDAYKMVESWEVNEVFYR